MLYCLLQEIHSVGNEPAEGDIGCAGRVRAVGRPEGCDNGHDEEHHGVAGVPAAGTQQGDLAGADIRWDTGGRAGEGVLGWEEAGLLHELIQGRAG